MSHPVQPVFDILKADEIRKRRGLSYAAIAERMGLKARQTVGHWFRGRGEPDMRQLKAMADVLGCHWLELVTEDTTVLYEQEEIERVQKVRDLSPEARAKLDAFIAVESLKK